MEDLLTRVDRIIEEHHQKLVEIRAIESTAWNAAIELNVPIQFGQVTSDNSKKIYQILYHLLTEFNESFKQHMYHEINPLVKFFTVYKESILAAAFLTHIEEHKELKKRIAKSIRYVAELAGDDLSPEVWQGKTWGTYAYINHTRKLIEAHIETENTFLATIRERLTRVSAHP